MMSSSYQYATLLTRISSRKGWWLTYAVIAALSIAYRYAYSKKNNKFVLNLASVGRLVSDGKQTKESEEGDFDEFDVIIVGGGMLFLMS
jgi:hypothetical protein